MVVLKIVGKIMLVPVWFIVAMTWLLVKVVVAVYSFARGLVIFGLMALILGTIVCYQDWKQVAFVACIGGGMIVVLVAGTIVEVLLESVRMRIGKEIIM